MAKGHPRAATLEGTCTRCRATKPRDAFGTRSDGHRKRVCNECLDSERTEFEARRQRRKVRATPKGPEKFCNLCGRWLPMDAEHFYVDGRGGNRIPFVGPCIECKLAAGKAYRQAMLSDPATATDFERRRRESRRRWEEKNAERMAEMKNDWRRRAMKNPAYRRRRQEMQRMAYRLRRERAGHPVRPVMKAPRWAGFSMIPAAPIVELIDRRIAAHVKALNGHAENIDVRGLVCSSLGIADRQYRAWQSGEIRALDIDTVDRILLNSALHWWDVFDPDRWPEAAAIAERAFEPGLT